MKWRRDAASQPASEQAPVAELAWELSVAVVDAARVLHVLVAVVAVGEHFAAVVALVTLTRLLLRAANAVPTYTRRPVILALQCALCAQFVNVLDPLLVDLLLHCRPDLHPGPRRNEIWGLHFSSSTVSRAL